jgi:hypothetical protein
VPDQPSQERLLDLYRIALDEYRFEVRLGWDRTMYFLVLNSAIITVATGLLKLDNIPVVDGFVAVIFLFGFGTSVTGSFAISKSHEYYRRTVVQKTRLEDLLGLTSPPEGSFSAATLSIGTTTGQRDHAEILADPEKWVKRRHRRTSITFMLKVILLGLAVVDLIGAFAAVMMLIHNPALRGASRTMFAVLVALS